MVDLAVGDHCTHQVERFRRQAEAKRGEAREEARGAQHAHRILDEGAGHVSQQSPLDVAAAVERIHQAPACVLGDRIDGEVAAAQIILQRHLGTGVEGEAGIAAAALALGARQGVLLLADRVQEHREIGTDRTETGCPSLRACRRPPRSRGRPPGAQAGGRAPRRQPGTPAFPACGGRSRAAPAGYNPAGTLREWMSDATCLVLRMPAAGAGCQRRRRPFAR
jgi:hypothetical protein